MLFRLRYLTFSIIIVCLGLSGFGCLQFSVSWPVGDGSTPHLTSLDGEPNATETASLDWVTKLIGGVQSAATIAAIFLGAIFAWRNRHLFRYGHPHLTIDHKISHRQVSQLYTQISVTAILYNSSRVKVDVQNGLFTVQQVAPVDDSYVVELYKDTFGKRRNLLNGVLQWYTLNEIPLFWMEGTLIVEPGESATATFEYIVPNLVTSILVTTYFYNLRVMGRMDRSVDPKREDAKNRRWWFGKIAGPRGWIRSATYDIVR